MPKGNRKKQYYECPECGRTALLLYDEPEPIAALGCDDGHEMKDMRLMTTDKEINQ